jgi:hypothetical protein
MAKHARCPHCDTSYELRDDTPQGLEFICQKCRRTFVPQLTPAVPMSPAVQPPVSRRRPRWGRVLLLILVLPLAGAVLLGVAAELDRLLWKHRAAHSQTAAVDAVEVEIRAGEHPEVLISSHGVGGNSASGTGPTSAGAAVQVRGRFGDDVPAPQLIAPAPGAQLSDPADSTWTFHWSEVEGAVLYRLLLNVPGNPPRLIVRDVTGLQVEFPPGSIPLADLPQTGWKWQVQASDWDGRTTDWSAAATFEVVPADEPPAAGDELAAPDEEPAAAADQPSDGGSDRTDSGMF